MPAEGDTCLVLLAHPNFAAPNAQADLVSVASSVGLTVGELDLVQGYHQNLAGDCICTWQET